MQRSLLCLVLLTIVGCREQLIQNVSEQQANRLMTRLNDKEIRSRKRRQAENLWAVEVDQGDLPAAMREMQKLRLIREASPGSSEGASVVSSRDQQRFAFERSLSAEIEQTLSSFDGVLEARTHLNLPQVDPLFGKVVPGARGSGGVFLIVEGTLKFSREDIAHLVAGAAGIKAEDISVLIEESTLLGVVPEVVPVAVVPVAVAVEKVMSEKSMAEMPELKSVVGFLQPYFPIMAGIAAMAAGCWVLRQLVLSKET